MIYGYLFILGLYLFLFIVSGKENVDSYYQREEKRKSYPGERFFLKAAAWCVRQKNAFRKRYGKKSGRYREELDNRLLGKNLKLLCPALPERQQVREFHIRQYAAALAVLFFGNLLSCAAALSALTDKTLQDGSYINRKSYEQGDTDVLLSARVEGEEAKEIFYSVGEQKYTEEEIRLLHQSISALLPEMILGANESLEEVVKDLKLITFVEGYPFVISWESGSYSLVHTDGSVFNEELDGEEIVMLTAYLRYEETEFTEVLPVRILPAVYTEEEAFLKKMKQSLEEQDRASRTETAMKLPSRIGNKEVAWKEVIQDSSGSLFLLMCIAAVLVFFAKNRELETKLKKRNQELLLDYPEIVNKLMLYLGAGMTIRNAFLKMGEDYKRQGISVRKRYVYEEILLLSYELQSGVPETEAYAHLGNRCNLQAYRKLCTLLAQNLRKGSNDLLMMLRQEAAHAFDERKNTAKKLGEEAGTKLLLPMMMMLCIVMVIIMIPAYFSFA